MSKKKVYKVIICIGLLLIVIGAVCTFLYFKELYEGRKVYEDMQKNYVIQDQSVKIPIDFEALQKENPDIYAWLYLEGTVINYPIVQSPTDDAFYLEHTVNGVESYIGSIYTEMANSKDFSDFNTVIYGHNIKDGSMFGCLHDFKDGAVFDERNELIIYTPTSVLHYTIFAAHVYDNRHLLLSFDDSTENGRLAFLQSMYSSTNILSNYDHSVNVSTYDKIVTLSTCMSNEANERFLVQGVLNKVEQGTQIGSAQ